MEFCENLAGILNKIPAQYCVDQQLNYSVAILASPYQVCTELAKYELQLPFWTQLIAF